jgi:hypothetical protein
LKIQPGKFHLGEFRDDSVSQCFPGVSPDEENYLSLYLKNDQLTPIIEALIKRKRVTIATLKLRSLGKSHQRKQFEIAKIHHVNWLTLPKE